MLEQLSVIILTHQEERNLPYALHSLGDWPGRIFVLDSYSTDATKEIAMAKGCHVQEHPFHDYATQRNYALTHLPITTEWVMFIDADEIVSAELKEEITRLLGANPKENGFYVRFRLFFQIGRAHV